MGEMRWEREEDRKKPTAFRNEVGRMNINLYYTNEKSSVCKNGIIIVNSMFPSLYFFFFIPLFQCILLTVWV